MLHLVSHKKNVGQKQKKQLMNFNKITPIATHMET